MEYTFDSAAAPDRRTVQYFEMLGNRAIYKDGWMASTQHGIPWKTAGQDKAFDADVWELYDLTTDFSEANDLAKQNPPKLKELLAAFDAEARKYNVFPLDDRFAQRVDPRTRPNPLTGLTSFTYGPGVAYIGPNATLSTNNVPFRSRRRSMRGPDRPTESSPPQAGRPQDGRCTSRTANRPSITTSSTWRATARSPRRRFRRARAPCAWS